MALTDSATEQPRERSSMGSTLKPASSTDTDPPLRRRLARHRRGQPHLWLRRLGPPGRFQRTASSVLQLGQHHFAAYTAKVRVTVRAGGQPSFGKAPARAKPRAPTPGQAHELALKGCRDRRHQAGARHLWQSLWACALRPGASGVARSRGAKGGACLRPWILRAPPGTEQARLQKPSEFAAALQKGDERGRGHRASIRHLGAKCRDRACNQPRHEAGPAAEVRHRAAACRASQAMRNRISEAGGRGSPDEQSSDASDQLPSGKPKIDKSVLTIGQAEAHPLQGAPPLRRQPALR